jgi:hypothetical protein
MSLMNFKLFVLLLFFSFTGFSQDIFNYESSSKYAEYLFYTRDYLESSKEYARLRFTQPNDTTNWVLNVMALQRIGAHEKAASLASKASTRFNLNSFCEMQLFSLLKLERDLSASICLDCCSGKDFSFYYHVEPFLKHDLRSSLIKVDATSLVSASLSVLHQDFYNERFKRPGLAAVMSTVVPGSGKVYAGRWKDGLFSVLLLGTSAWQAWRLIDKKGIENPFSIFFTGMSVGFYMGNIYGSHKAANEYNSRIYEEYNERATDILDSYYPYN